MSITATCRALVAQLTADGIADPLNEPLALFALWADLCRIAGEPEPPEVAALLDGPAVACPAPPSSLAGVPTARRGSFMDWERQFHEDPA